jgi:hypothetical protein
MSSTTNIHDLPTDPVGGGNSTGNISFSASEKTSQPNTNTNTNANANANANASQVALDQTTINQIISGLQLASVAGATQLPSKDISMSTETLTHDVQIKPNYIPQADPQSRDYIKENETNNEIMNEYNNNISQSNSLDELYDEMQIPLLLGVLYFIFQLPIVRKSLFAYLPFLFHIDGNFNINGYVITSVMFGIIYYILTKTVSKINRFTL